MCECYKMSHFRCQSIVTELDSSESDSIINQKYNQLTTTGITVGQPTTFLSSIYGEENSKPRIRNNCDEPKRFTKKKTTKQALRMTSALTILKNQARRRPEMYIDGTRHY